MSSATTALLAHQGNNNPNNKNYATTTSKKSNNNNNNTTTPTNESMSRANNSNSNASSSSMKTAAALNSNISIHSNDSGLGQSLSSNASSSFTSPNHSSSIPSPTISLISSSSSSPSSASSSPISNLLSNSSMINNNNGHSLNTSLNKLVAESAKKSAALSNISATIAKHQKNQLIGSLAPAKTAKLNQESANGGGVSCAIVKSNTNIYYNSKVETAASKAIHYCNQCTNVNCGAVHKSLTKPLIAHSQPLQLTATPLFSSPLLANTGNISHRSVNSSGNSSSGNFGNTSGNSGNSSGNFGSFGNSINNNNISSSSSTRIVLSPQPPTPNQMQVTNSASQQSNVAQNAQSSQNSQFNKLLGANINFIFERRYPLVQLNSNLFNTAVAGTAQPLQNAQDPTTTQTLTSALNQLATQSIANQQQLLHHQQYPATSTRHPLKYASNHHRGGSHDMSSHRFSFSGDENEAANTPPTVPTSPLSSFPLPGNAPVSPVSPSGKPSTFSINFNRLLPSQQSNTPQATSSLNRRHLLNSQNQLLLQQINEAIENSNLNSFNTSNHNTNNNNNSDSTSSNSNNAKKRDQFATSDLVTDLEDTSINPMFPINLNNLNLRYKNIMFLDQVKTYAHMRNMIFV